MPYPGASPETVEREIINRLEKQMLSDHRRHRGQSYANEGSATIVLQFDFKRNLIEASDDVRNAIASVRYKLPIEMREPILRASTPAQPIMNLALSSTKQSHAEISRLAEDVLADRFRGIDGVANVNVNGSLRRELSVLLHAESCANTTSRWRSGPTPCAPEHQCAGRQGARRTGREGHPPGRPHRASGRFPAGRGQAPRRHHRAPEPGGRDRDGFAEIEQHFDPQRQPERRHLRSSARATLDRVDRQESARDGQGDQEGTAAGTKLEVTRDGGDDAQRSLNNVIESLVFGAVLTIFVVYAFLNSWRSTLITALSLPTSVLAAFIAVWLCGFTLNFMTLLGCRWRSAC
jgi:hypothetical protein